MQTEILLYILFSGILALLLALFQYAYKTQYGRGRIVVFTFLRFLTYFGILLILINPKLTTVRFYNEKPALVVAVDNSESIQHLKQSNNAKKVLSTLQSNRALAEKFDIDYVTLGAALHPLDSLQFNEKQTHIDKAFKALYTLYKGITAPIILISDGNQTIGNTYTFSANKVKQPIYPIILGDTITYTDLKINQLNVNKYAYLKNKFPVEVIVSYNGHKTISSQFKITSGATVLYSKTLSFSKDKSSYVLQFTLPAQKIGVRSYTATLSTLPREKNTVNNSKNFAVEVIDQKTKVAIVSTLLHPDLGMLKKSIESNKQRTVQFFKPKDIIGKLNDFELIILYQPNTAFQNVFKALDIQNKNRFVITGTQTDWHFLNTIVGHYTKDISNQTENYQSILNPNYTTFTIDALEFESFPPVVSVFGDIVFNAPAETLLYKQLDGITTASSLLSTIEVNGRREALLLGENSWKWRAQSYRNQESFEPFDNFIGKLVQYLASNQRKKRITLDYESFYNGNTNVSIKAQYFDKNYVFDTSETITILLKDIATGHTSSYPLLLKNNRYQVDLSHLPPSEYTFTVSTGRDNLKQSGRFKILKYNMEQQFLNADVVKLQQVAAVTNGRSYFVDHHTDIVNDLLNDKRYLPIQKQVETTTSFIDWQYLLFFIVLTLALEWFLRKYSGLV